MYLDFSYQFIIHFKFNFIKLYFLNLNAFFPLILSVLQYFSKNLRFHSSFYLLCQFKTLSNFNYHLFIGIFIFNFLIKFFQITISFNMNSINYSLQCFIKLFDF